MSHASTVPTLELYRQWRNGDPDAGQSMAQRFSDWYYAVTASRLGDAHGRVPLQRSCTRFQQGIVSVAKETELVAWAHGILSEELQTAGGRIPGGDFPNLLTGNRAPSELLQAARAGLSTDDVRLLAHAYDSTYPLGDVTREAEALGGMPLAVLRARYALKRWLRDNAAVNFSEVPDEPNLDYAPLPLYEAGRMSNAAEETNFEKWLLSNMSLCKDIAEFGVFALALRAGAFRGVAPVLAPSPVAPAVSPPLAAAAAPAVTAAAAKAHAPAAARGEAKKTNLVPIVIGAVVGLGLLIALVALLGGFALRG